MRFDPDFGFGKFLKLYLYKFVLRITLSDSAPIFFLSHLLNLSVLTSPMLYLCSSLTLAVIFSVSPPCLHCPLPWCPERSHPPPCRRHLPVSVLSSSFTEELLRLLLSAPCRIPFLHSVLPDACGGGMGAFLPLALECLGFPRPRACTAWRVRLGVGLQGGSVPPSQ